MHKHHHNFIDGQMSMSNLFTLYWLINQLLTRKSMSGKANYSYYVLFIKYLMV